MATQVSQSDSVAFPASLTALLLALRDARAAVLAAQDPHDEAEMRHLLTASIVAAQDRDLARVLDDARIRATVDAERELVTYREAKRSLDLARAVHDAVEDRLLAVAARHLPANDSSDQAAE
jgi:hypothetical protein